MDDQIFMQAALEQARRGRDEGNIPAGAVLVRDGMIISRGHHRRMLRDDSVMHATADCLHNAGQPGDTCHCTLYTTLSPCGSCSAAILRSGITRVVIGDQTNVSGTTTQLQAGGVEVTILNDPQCIALMQQFMVDQPGRWQQESASA